MGVGSDPLGARNLQICIGCSRATIGNSYFFQKFAGSATRAVIAHLFGGWRYVITLATLMLVAHARAAVHIARAIWNLHTAEPSGLFEVCPLVEVDQAITERLGFRDRSLWNFLCDLGLLCS